jgi:RimJ/RimL family protein N-acetyltransferase
MMIKNIAFGELSLNRIFGELFEIRPQYAEAFENAGFMLEGVLKAHSRLNGKLVDSLVYGILNTK